MKLLLIGASLDKGAIIMGKDLKGKELGKGLSQEKLTKYYIARFVDRYGKRQTRRFRKLQEARQWIADATYNDLHSSINFSLDTTVDAFFDFWIETCHKTSKANTIQAYKYRYYKNIQSVIGSMKISEVKLAHCQMIISKMIDENYSNSSIMLAGAVMKGLFEYAVECDVIMKNPYRVKLKKSVGKPKAKKEALATSEQERFLEAIQDHPYENQYRFILQTGLRIGELMGLKWEDVDFQKKTISIQRTMRYVYGEKEWQAGTPKSDAGYRTIPLTDEAVAILKNQKKKNASYNVVRLNNHDYIFISEKGSHLSATIYDTALEKICRKAGLRYFSVHILRHTFATRCIEAGMKPKTLQTIMGHAQIGVTMDLYVHTTEDEMANEVMQVAGAL